MAAIVSTVFSEEKWWSIASSLLNFSIQYRVTGIFSDMHTGGEVLDGVLVLLLPLSMAVMLRSRRIVSTLIGLGAVLAVGYVIAVGITRATWAAAAFAVFATVIAEAALNPGDRSRDARVLAAQALTFLAAVALARWLQIQSGSEGLLAYGLATSASVLVGIFARRLSVELVALTPVLILAGGYALSAHMDSRYAVDTASTRLAVPLSVLLIGLVMTMGAKVAWPATVSARVRLAVLLVLLPGGLAVVLGGYSMGSRLATASTDLDTRKTHWGRVVTSADPSVSSRWLGNGVGTFPQRYILSFPDTLSSIGSYEVRPLGNGNLLLGSGHDLTLRQRVAIEPETDYRVVLRILPQGTGTIVFGACEQNQLITGYARLRCARDRIRYGTTDVDIDERGYEVHRVVLNSGDVASRAPLMRWPVSFLLAHADGEAAVTIGDVSVSGPDGEVLYNGDFKRGSDGWLFYANRAHLPWHIKNLWLQAWYETGWLGAALLLLLVGSLVVRTARIGALEPTLIPIAVAVCSVGVLGAFASPLDSPRVSLWFYFLLFAGLFIRPASHTRSGQVTRDMP